MAAEQGEYVGWQFRYVFEDQGNRRAAWSTVMEGEPSFTSGYRAYNGWQRRYFFEVRRVYAEGVEHYVEDPHHKPTADRVALPRGGEREEGDGTPEQEAFCTRNCCWSGHHKDCFRAREYGPAGKDDGDIES